MTTAFVIGVPLAILLLVCGVVFMSRTGGTLFGSGLTYKAFVAWRYLLVYPRRVSRRTLLALLGGGAVLLVLYLAFGVGIRIDLRNPLEAFAGAVWAFLLVVTVWGLLRFSKLGMYVFMVSFGIALLAMLQMFLLSSGHMPFVSSSSPTAVLIYKVAYYLRTGALGLAGLALFIGSLRSTFTFFTTVPIVGVFLGTTALVVVLSVMAGFETDLRDKILGSNAHIQITREDGEFANWREVKAKIDKIPDVVASTPYATSEVVVATNNAQNVVIKGIDPKTVGMVTDLISDLEDPKSIDQLDPLIEAGHDRTVPQKPQPTGGVDPAPSDMPTGGDPIDFSGSGGASGSGSDASSDRGSADEIEPEQLPPPPAPAPASAKVIDPAPDDLLTTDEEPLDFSQPEGDSVVHVVDIPPESALSRRTQALPGILVGRELVKQSHLYTGQEVRIVSPLSDPSNPDATGTPIPFNRDYRVAGVFFTGMYEYDFKYVYVTLESLQDFLDRGDTIDGIEVRISDPDQTEAFLPSRTDPGRILKALGPGYRVVDWRELNRSLFSALKLEKIAMFLVLGIVILVASFSIVGNLIMVVMEKGREIALLKTLGASDAGVMQLFAIQGLIIGSIGTLLGVAVGLIACWVVSEVGVPLDPNVYYIDRLPIHVDPESVAAAAAAGVLISIAATFYPALLAARVRPATGLRQ